MKYLKRRLAEAIEWRFRERLEAERLAMSEMSRTYLESATKLTDQVRMLEARVLELESQLRKRGVH